MKALPLTLVVVLGSFITANSLFAQGPTAFASSTYTVSSSSSFVAVEDVNGDGKPDLISSDTLGTVLTNDGSGDFDFMATLYGPIILVGFNVINVVPADINGDGKPDLIASDYVLGNGELETFTNDGSGNFDFYTNFFLGYRHFVAVMVPADVNNNGKPDLICSYSTNTVLVLTNNGIGVFGLNAMLRVGNEPMSIAAADVNGDGKLDLIAANYGDNTLTVLTNNGTGVFSFNAVLNVGLQPYCVIAADLYGNGKLDLITANSGTDTLTILTNNGNGIFGFNATLPVGSRPNCVAAADVNHDRKLDLISANGDGSLTVLTQVTVGPPVLKVTATSTNALILSWASFLPGFKLITNSDLTTTNWAPTDNAIFTSDGTNRSVIFTPLPSGSLFFRLRQ